MAKIYEALTKTGGPELNQAEGSPLNLSSRKLLEFRNIKQSGDIEKKIYFYNKKQACKIFNFTCSSGKEGVSTIVVNLIKYISRKKSDKRVLLIDANLADPMLHEMLGVSNENGLIGCLAGVIAPHEAIHKLQASSIDFMPCGRSLNPISSSGLQQENFIELLGLIKDDYDYIIIDSAPLLTSADSLSAAVVADVTFLVVQSLKITKEVAERAKTLLTENECLIGGVILNRVKQVIPDWMYKIL